MTLHNKLKIGIVSLISLISIGVAAPHTVLAAAKDDILNSVNATDPGGPTVDNAVAAAINIFSWLVGFAAIVMMILGGYKYITSSGDANKAAQAKSTVMYALIGVALVVVSQVLIRFVIAKSTATTGGGGGGAAVCAPGRPC